MAPNSPYYSLTSQSNFFTQNTFAHKFASRSGGGGGVGGGGGDSSQLSSRDIFDIDKREQRRKQWKRDLIGRSNGTLDPWYGCFLFEELYDYAINFTFPWSELTLFFFCFWYSDIDFFSIKWRI